MIYSFGQRVRLGDAVGVMVGHIPEQDRVYVTWEGNKPDGIYSLEALEPFTPVPDALQAVQAQLEALEKMHSEMGVLIALLQRKLQEANNEG